MGIEIHDGIELWKVRIFDPWQVMVLGSYYGLCQGTNTAVLTADKLYGQYFPLPRGATFDRIGIDVYTGVAGSHVRLGIYKDDDLDGYPESLVLDAGVVDTATSGEKIVAIDQHLEPGLYFIAFISDDAPAVWLTSTPGYPSPLGLGGTIGYPRFIYEKASVGYAALPDPFTAGGASVNAAWAVAMRLLSLD